MQKILRMSLFGLAAAIFGILLGRLGGAGGFFLLIGVGWYFLRQKNAGGMEGEDPADWWKKEERDL